jgi:hypothetical protein
MTRISDRVWTSRVISDVHPLLASAVTEISRGDKYRVEYVSSFCAIVHNGSAFSAAMARRGITWPPPLPYTSSPRIPVEPES